MYAFLVEILVDEIVNRHMMHNVVTVLDSMSGGDCGVTS
jgi:hypothetical protein